MLERGELVLFFLPPARRELTPVQSGASRRDAGRSRWRNGRRSRSDVGVIDVGDASDDTSSPIFFFSSSLLPRFGHFQLSAVAWHNLDLSLVHLGQD